MKLATVLLLAIIAGIASATTMGEKVKQSPKNNSCYTMPKCLKLIADYERKVNK